MTSLITLLISLLGYGTPADFEHYTEAELNEQIEIVQNDQAEGTQDDDGGILDDWDM